MTGLLLFWVGLMGLAGTTGALVIVRLFPEVFKPSRLKSAVLVLSYVLSAAVVAVGVIGCLRR